MSQNQQSDRHTKQPTAINLLKQNSNLLLSDDDIELPSNYRVVAINTAKDTDETLLAAIGRLRYKVWLEEGMDMSNAGGANSLIDTIDQDAILWGVYCGRQLVATARLNLYDDLCDSPTSYMHAHLNARYTSPVATFTRLVVDKHHQGMKIGKLLDQLRLEQARLLGAQSVMLMCPPYRSESLTKKGYLCFGKARPSKLWPDADWMVMAYQF